MYTFPDSTLRPRVARYGIRSVYEAVYTAREQLTRVHRHYTAMYIRRAREVYTAVTRP